MIISLPTKTRAGLASCILMLLSVHVGAESPDTTLQRPTADLLVHYDIAQNWQREHKPLLLREGDSIMLMLVTMNWTTTETLALVRNNERSGTDNFDNRIVKQVFTVVRIVSPKEGKLTVKRAELPKALVVAAANRLWPLVKSAGIDTQDPLAMAGENDEWFICCRDLAPDGDDLTSLQIAYALNPKDSHPVAELRRELIKQLGSE